MPVKHKQAPLTDEQRAERRRADRAYSREAVERLRSSEGWRRWLTTRRHFHEYTAFIWRASVLARKESADLRRRHVIKRLRPDLLSARSRFIPDAGQVLVLP